MENSWGRGLQVPPSSLGHSKRSPTPLVPEGSALALTGAGSPRDHLYLVYPDWGGGVCPLYYPHPYGSVTLGVSGQDSGGSFSDLLAPHPLFLLHLTPQVILWDSVMGRRHSPESSLSSITYCSVMLG